MRALFFGDRNLTWKHLWALKVCATHALIDGPVPLASLFDRDTGPDLLEALPLIPESESLVCIHGDGPPGTSTPGAIGADKLAELACMETWPERRRVRRFPPDVRPGATPEEWARAARDRNLAMVQAKPDRVYCLHANLDSSKGSRMTAEMLQNAGISFAYVRVSSAGAVLSVEMR